MSQIRYYNFYGIDTSRIKISSTKDVRYLIIEMIMKQDYFDGLSQLNEHEVCFVFCQFI